MVGGVCHEDGQAADHLSERGGVGLCGGSQEEGAVQLPHHAAHRGRVGRERLRGEGPANTRGRGFRQHAVGGNYEDA